MREHEIGRIENGRLVTPTEREYQSITISNPTNNQLKFLRGYSDIDKEQIASLEYPEYDETIHAVNEVYFINEETGKINKRYDVVELPTHDEENTKVETEIEG